VRCSADSQSLNALRASQTDLHFPTPKERAVQRILSVAALVGLGVAVWMFLSGGGFNQLAVDPNAPGAQAGFPGSNRNPQGSANSTAWNSGNPSPAQPTTPVVQPTSAGTTAPPLADGPTIHIASFNIQIFGNAKAENRPVINTLAEVIRRFDIVAIQEIRSQDEYLMSNFVKLINSNGRQYDFVIGPRVGNSKEKEQFAFVFDTERIMVDRNSVYTVGDPDNLLSREPLVATFSTRAPPDEAFTFILIDVHTVPDQAAAEIEALAEVYRVVRRAGRGEDDVIMLGDFNADDRNLGRLGQIPGIAPLIRGAFSNTRQKALYDNIIIHQPSTTEYAGRSGVFDLTKQFHLTLDQAEQVSDHFPVWAEFSAYERDYTGRVASRRANTR
jgi:endonuclease/exonuclease/phosphatase family metal-dependent hydrolase